MKSYFVELLEDGSLKIGFCGKQTTNDVLVKQASQQIKELKNQIDGSKVLKINGPASLPVAMMLAHEVSHICAAVACYDPKLGDKYVVVISHSPHYVVGSLID